MNSPKIIAVALLTAVAGAAETPALGTWNCSNISETGSESPWTLLIREDGAKLAGSLTDGDAKIPLSEVKLEGGAFSFRFYINENPYAFAGKVEGGKLEGKYSGEEAKGKLRCDKAVGQPESTGKSHR